jgi:GT2 family glycosyltransferase/tetratricopeptide (TPR) repeat protein
MERPPVSIVIPVWNAWPVTKQCLESLRPTIGVRDEIIVVDNGSTDATSRELRKIPGLHVITNAENLGFAKANNQGAEVARHDFILFLNNDTVLAKGWLEELLAPLFGNEGVGAVGPRSNYVSGDQLVESVPYATNSNLSGYREFARDWMREHRGVISTTERLVGFCLAVRKSAFNQVGGWDERYGLGGFEDDDLCAALISSGWELLISHGTYVHHHGSQTFAANEVDQFGVQEKNAGKYVKKYSGGPLVSACIIVKDEASNIAPCIESIKNFVDEVVVYDTGSSDLTVGIARGLGAKVTMGYWNDDFSQARNTALELCTGQWILQIDADEQLEITDPATLRSQLLRLSEDEAALSVSIINHDDVFAGGDVEHQAVRLFTREAHHWEGRLHERVLRRDTRMLHNAGLAPLMRLHHYGYTKEAIAGKEKTERNIRLATADLLDDKGVPAKKQLNLARSLMMAGDHSSALVHLEEAVKNPETKKEALRSGIEAHIELGDFSLALGWIDQLQLVGDDPSVVHYLRGQAFLGLGKGQEAVDEFSLVTSQGNTEFALGTLWFRKGRAYSLCEEWSNAYSCYCQAIEFDYNGEIWRPAFEAAARSSNLISFLEIAEGRDRKLVLSKLLFVDPEEADELAELCWQTQSEVMATLEFISYFAYKLSHQRALEWSIRFRQHNCEDFCPLIAMSADENRESTQRIQAAAMAANAFGDSRGTETIRGAAAALGDDQLTSMLVLLLQLAVPLVRTFLESAATTPARALSLADALEESGMSDGATELRLHASSMQQSAK